MVKDREIYAHKEWLGFLQPVGLVVSPPALVAAQAVINRSVVELQQRLLTNVETLQAESIYGISDFSAFTVDVLGWQPEDLVESPDDLAVSLPEYGEVLRSTYAVPDPDRDGWLMLVQVIPSGTDFDNCRDVTCNVSTGWHASPQAKFERLRTK